MNEIQKRQLDYLLVKARSAALHIGILKNHILVRIEKTTDFDTKFEILMILVSITWYKIYHLVVYA